MWELLTIGIVFLAIVFFDRSLGARSYTGPVTDHFDGSKFFNPDVTVQMEKDRTRNKSIWVWMLTRRRNTWLPRVVQTSKPSMRVHSGVCVTYINHATVLLQFSGLNIITDPVYAKRASPFSFLGPARYAAPGVAFDDLPPIDIVLLSHNHYDHMDLETLRNIDRLWRPRLYTGLGNAAYLARKGIDGAIEMDWWDSHMDDDLKIVCAPARHFSARTLSDRNRTLWCGFILETTHGPIYFSGDTGFGAFIKEIEHRYDSFVLALLPIGAYQPEWMMHLVHTSPDEALRMHERLRVRTSVAIHHGTFRLADDGQDEPRERLAELKGDNDFRVLSNGEAIRV